MPRHDPRRPTLRPPVGRRPVLPALPALALVLLTAAALAGCAEGSQTGGNQGPYGPGESYDSWHYSAGGQGTADESGTLDVPTGKVRATLSVGGQASIHLLITDDDGDVVMRLDCTGSGGCSKSRTSPSSTPGTWRVELKGLYSGGVSTTVQPVE